MSFCDDDEDEYDNNRMHDEKLYQAWDLLFQPTPFPPFALEAFALNINEGDEGCKDDGDDDDHD